MNNLKTLREEQRAYSRADLDSLFVGLVELITDDDEVTDGRGVVVARLEDDFDEVVI